MYKILLRSICSILFIFIARYIITFVLTVLEAALYFHVSIYTFPIPSLAAIFLGIAFYFTLSKPIANKYLSLMNILEQKLSIISLKVIIVATLGGITGLTAATLCCFTLHTLGAIGNVIVITLNLLLASTGIRIALLKKDEFTFKTISDADLKLKHSGIPKILDTSVIIDGRILDILQTGFVEGNVIIPDFILKELRHIADSSDGLKRNRGRRGLDILNEIQKQSAVKVEIANWDSSDEDEVDIKLLKIAQSLNASIVTNDFNLNKVAYFQGVQVLNINELANAIKPVVLPGEDMTVDVLRLGKENGQGIGYLSDGTMIVVDGGHKHIGDSINVLVTSVLQTAAGRMIFTKTKES